MLLAPSNRVYCTLVQQEGYSVNLSFKGCCLSIVQETILIHRRPLDHARWADHAMASKLKKKQLLRVAMQPADQRNIPEHFHRINCKIDFRTRLSNPVNRDLSDGKSQVTRNEENFNIKSKSNCFWRENMACEASWRNILKPH